MLLVSFAWVLDLSLVTGFVFCWFSVASLLFGLVCLIVALFVLLCFVYCYLL